MHERSLFIGVSLLFMLCRCYLAGPAALSDGGSA